MLINSSSSSNATLPPHPSISNFIHTMHSCVHSTVGAVSITTFTVMDILILLPLCMHVIYLGLQRWRQQHPGATASHSDIFTYHMVVIELMSIVGGVLCCCGIFTDLKEMTTLGIYLSTFNLSGQQFFHALTCVERYLAVVHPIVFLSSRRAKGIRIRNIIIGCVWVLCFLSIGVLYAWDSQSAKIVSYCISVFILIITSFCSLSVLCVLIRPGPGEGSGGRQRVDQSKLRAFYTIMAILGVLLLRFGGTLVSVSLYDLPQLGETERCSAWLSVMWYDLPSNLVVPLLFLHRAGKLPCCRSNSESGHGSN